VCGIFGWITNATHRRGRDELIRLTDVMFHRGPDAGGYELLEICGGQTTLGLGHRRLAILDLSDAGRQPMWSADRSICVVFNGEIYNFIELREELVARGHVFKTHCDTEVLIEAYRAFGEDALTRFRGMFAFALYDARKDSVLFARDAFGKKPLYIYEKDGDLAFSSEILPLTRLSGFDARFNWGALDNYLIDRYVPHPDTFFANIRKLAPGHSALWSKGKLSIKRFYTPPLARRSPDIASFADATHQFRAALDEAVHIRMRSDAPFGAFLSGGIDSSAVLALMSRHSATPISTFSANFDVDGYSEAKEAAAVAAHFGADHHAIDVGPELFLNSWDEAILNRGAPVSEGSDIAILLLSKYAGERVKMVLTGEGADEFMCGYPKYQVERYAALYQQFVGPSAHALFASMLERLPGARRLKIVAQALAVRDPQERMRVWFGDIPRAGREALLGRASPAVCAPAFALDLADASDVRRAQYFDQLCWLPDNLLERGDRMMMAGAVEGRMPFMDTELAELCARIPDRFMMRAGFGKAVLRESMKGLLPAWVLYRRKNGFRVPFQEWLRGPHRERLSDLLLSSEATTPRLLRRGAIESVIERHMSGAADNSRILWSLMNLEKFMRVFKPDLGAGA
jgi:asparagine synthase (glutamine-hydrolysing)